MKNQSLLNYVPNVPYVPSTLRVYVPLKDYVSTCLVNKTKTRNCIIFKFFEKFSVFHEIWYPA